jgi:2-polyprenyl-3-methyl-5-hydroxy-6-metoxy-1,4-benzoquinol methylase
MTSNAGTKTDSVRELTFDDFENRARDDSLSPFEKIGFPNSYREGKEEAIFRDITEKVSNLGKKTQRVLEIGPGCSGPAFMMIEWCRQQGHQLALVDSAGMLTQLPDAPIVEKITGRYPDDVAGLFEKHDGSFDAIICYSVLHYIFGETNLFDFLDKSLSLLAHGGQMLVGDIPNVSKRKRFFSSPAGVSFHQEFTGSKEVPDVRFNQVDAGKIDDSVLFSQLLRARHAGFDAYLLPQPPHLPMANRREDILIMRP